MWREDSGCGEVEPEPEAGRQHCCGAQHRGQAGRRSARALSTAVLRVVCISRFLVRFEETRQT